MGRYSLLRSVSIGLRVRMCKDPVPGTDFVKIDGKSLT